MVRKNLQRMGRLVLGTAVMVGLTACGGEATEEAAPAAQAATPAAPAPAVAAASGDTEKDERIAKLERQLKTSKAREKGPRVTSVQGGTVESSTPGAVGSSPELISGRAKKVGAEKGEPDARATSVAAADGLAASAQAISPDAPVNRPGVDVANAVKYVIVEPEVLDLGIIPTGEASVGVVKLKNISEAPRRLVECKTSCGCTTTKCPKGTVIQPGESVDVEVKLDGGAAQRALNKSVTFIVEEQAPLRMTVKGEAVAFVTIEPATMDWDENPEGRFVIRAIDDEPFIIKSMYPPVIDDFSAEPAIEHELYLDWEKWAELANKQRKLLFAVDHPKCSKVNGTVTVKAMRKGMELTGQLPGGEKSDDIAVRPRPGGPNIEEMLKNDETEKVLGMIADGTIQVDGVDGQGRSPLTVASLIGNVDVMAALLDGSADLEASDSTGRTPLMYAAQSKNVEAVVLLLDSGASVQARDQIGNHALCWAAAFGDAASVGELIDAGAEVDLPGTATGFTPLIWASGFGEVGSVKLLIEAGGNLEARDAFEKATPIMYAARTNRKDNVLALIEAGADLEARDSFGNTPLLMAASNAGPDAEMIQLLVDAGVDLEATNDADKSALDLARNRTDLRSEEVIELLKKLLGVTDDEPQEPAPAPETPGDG